MTDKHLLCFLLLSLPLCWAEDKKINAGKKENDTRFPESFPLLLGDSLLQTRSEREGNTAEATVIRHSEAEAHYIQRTSKSEHQLGRRFMAAVTFFTERRGNKETSLVFWGSVKTRRLFARQKISPLQQSPVIKHRSNIMSPARRCGRLMENCSSHIPCCDPCASCRCRLFNTICHCWRMNPLCLKRT